MPRKASIERITKETQIKLSLAIDGKGETKICTSVPFLDHMLELFAKHGGFDLTLEAKGDLDVDQHHTVEDCGIALGQLFAKALGDRKGINRAGYFVMPMDETLAVVAVDLTTQSLLWAYRYVRRAPGQPVTSIDEIEFAPRLDQFDRWLDVIYMQLTLQP